MTRAGLCESSILGPVSGTKCNGYVTHKEAHARGKRELRGHFRGKMDHCSGVVSDGK